MARRRNRKHSKIDFLNPEVKSAVEEMIVSSQFTYKEIVEYIQDNTGTQISQAAVCRYAKGLAESLETIRIAQENFAAIMREVNRNPNLDTTEGIIQLLSHQMLTYVQQLSEDDLKAADPVKMMKQASELVKVAAYKRSMDIKNKELSEMGFDAVKEKVFMAMARDNPELYGKFTEYLDNALKDGEM